MHSQSRSAARSPASVEILPQKHEVQWSIHASRVPTQLADHEVAAWRNLEIMRRSALGMLRAYNLLPQEVVDRADVVLPKCLDANAA